jgi:hypothetical protein
MRKPRFRHTWMIGGSIAVLLLLFFTDPDDGLSTGMLLLSLVVPIIAILFSHWGRKAFFDYPEADMRLLFAEARKSSTGAGLALIAIAIVIFGLLMLFSKPVGAAEPPVAAMKYLPILSMEKQKFWPDHPYPAVLGGLIEHESCITLRHARCWNPSSRLKTQREEGAGFGQITRAYTSAGALRFDALQEMRDRHPALREWTWANVYERPDLQLRAVVLKSKDDYAAFAGLVDAYAALAFADAAYNGGRAGVQKERRACGLKKDCDPGHWFGHVELTCLKSRKALYGGRSACDINRHHVRDVLLVRAPKYEKYLI